MRFTVMAAERAPIMATMIQRICRSAGQECAVTRAARRAPVSANGSANTECSNLIISSTVRIRPGLIARLSILRASFAATRPAVLLFLRQADLRKDAADVLRHQVVNRFRLVIEGRDGRHDDGARLLRAKHVLEMDTIEGS